MDTNEIIKCKICSSDAAKAFEHIVLKKYNVAYYKCQKCGFLFTEEPYWLDSAYDKAIASVDTGVMHRNLSLMVDVYSLLNVLKLNQSHVLDFGGGYGVLCRLMRDLGVNCKWYDAHSPNLLARGFEGGLNDKYDCIISFEVLEHFSNPSGELDNIFNTSEILICSTNLIPRDIPDCEWEYYSFPTGQHISFYALETMHEIAKKYQKKYYNIWGLHVFLNSSLNTSQQLVIKMLGFSRKVRMIYFAIQRKLNNANLTRSDSLSLFKNLE